jgi:hypothetical protein
MVLHVGDRLLTADGSSWDPLGNKSVVLLGSDGWASFSYSGLAYVDSKPTDQWLADVLSERPAVPPLLPGRGPGIMFGGNFVPRVGPSLARLRAGIERDFSRQPGNLRSLGMNVLVAGFIFRGSRRLNPRPRPFMRRYRHSGLDTSQLEQSDVPRYWDWSRGIRVGSVGVDPGDAKRAALSELGSDGARNQDDCERILVDCVRAVSRDHDTVGADCMSIVLSSQGNVRVRFLPDPANDSGQAAHTPWILAPGAIVPPMVLTGGLPHLSAGPFLVELDRLPPVPPSGPHTASSQPRRRFP